MRILVFGDSIGYGEYDSRGGWANRIYLDYLNRQADDLQGDHPFIFNLSVGGHTTRDIIRRLPHETEARRYQGEDFAFVFAVGINDSRRDAKGDFVSTPEQYAKDLQDLYTAAKMFSDRMLFVGLTPVEADTRKFETARVWQFEQVLRAFTKQNNIPFVPVFEQFEERKKAGDKMFLDGLHPNDAGHELLYEKIKPTVQEF